MTLTIDKDVLEAVLDHVENGITSKVNAKKMFSIFVPAAKKALEKEDND
jgi:hypothetical protein